MRLDLGSFRTSSVRVFAGRDRGEEVRKRSKVDDLVRRNEPVEVFVPLDVMSVNSSFFLAMFGDAIRSLGASRFREVFSFTGRDISRTVEACIKEALRTSSPLTLSHKADDRA